MNNFFLLQAERINEGAYRLTDYGPIGIVAFIAVSGFVIVIILMRKKYETDLQEKNMHITELKEEVKELRNEVRAMQNGMMRDATRMMENCAIAIDESSSLMARFEGFITRRDEHMETIFNKVIDKFN